jgi:hypothetical protein
MGWFGPESLVFGERQNGTVVHISEVVSGLACRCYCPGCKAPLVARKGDLKDHHFGHHGASETPTCQTGAETALHKFAKECLGRRLELSLPALEQLSGASARSSYPGGLFGFDAAILEHRLDDIIPDVIVRKRARNLMVEFRVTHPCGEAKVAKFVDMNVAAVEIDLSWLPRDVTRIGLEEAILVQAPRRWLHNPRLRAHLAEDSGPSASIPSSRRPKSLLRLYRAASAEVRAMRPASLAAERIVNYGLSRAIGIEVPGSGCFTVPAQDWQAALLEQALDRAVAVNKPLITAADALNQLRHRRWVRNRFLRLKPSDADALKTGEPLFAMPFEAVSAWAAALARLSILMPAGGQDRWILWPEVVQSVRRVRRTRTTAGDATSATSLDANLTN